MRADLQQHFEFDEYRLDPVEGQLWRGDQAIRLRPKNLEVLCFLASRSEKLVTTDELLEEVWGNVIVSPATVTQSILQLRRALSDSARDPRFIATVPKRGFRFIAKVRLVEHQLYDLPNASSDPAFHEDRLAFVGRDKELNCLLNAYKLAESGQRQIVFVTGEAGLGKTTLVREFLTHLTATTDVNSYWHAVGHCVELSNDGEAYAPIFDILDELARVNPKNLVPTLQRFAPSWVEHLPWLLDSADRPQAPQITQSRMLRELCVALETIAKDRPLILWLEDLHWADTATIDVINLLANRTAEVKLLVIASYRATEAAMTRHPVADVKRTLYQRNLCDEIAPELLTREDIEIYLDRNVGAEIDVNEIGTAMYELSGGNPFFLSLLYKSLFGSDNTLVKLGNSNQEIAQRLRENAATTLRESLELQLSRLDEVDIELLEAASAVGIVFDVPTVAAALGKNPLDVEAVCRRLAGWHFFIVPAAPHHLPDASIAEQYAFHHAVIRQTLYDHIPPIRRRQIHGRVASWLEQAYEGDPNSIATNLAHHFESAGNQPKAITYLMAAAFVCSQLRAYKQSIALYQQALELKTDLPDTEDQQTEVAIRLALMQQETLAFGYGSKRIYSNILQLCELQGLRSEPMNLATVLAAKGRYHHAQADFTIASTTFNEILDLKELPDYHPIVAFAHGSMAMLAVWTAEHELAYREIALAESNAEKLSKLDSELLSTNVLATTLAAKSHLAWLRGFPDQARESAADAVSITEDLPFIHCATLGSQSEILRYCGDAEGVIAVTDRADELRATEGLSTSSLFDLIAAPWSRAKSGELRHGIEQLRLVLVSSNQSGFIVLRTYLLAALAELHLEAKDLVQGRRVLEEAIDFSETHNELAWQSELYRLRGEFSLLEGQVEGARAEFEKALNIASRHGSRSLELRAATSLARLRTEQGFSDEALAFLAPIYDWFTEGFDTHDLREAKTLLDRLRS